MPRYELELNISNIGSRNDIRMQVVNELAKELPGEGKDKLATKYTYELIIKSLKWLSIEQDIRYWNYSGRDMLWKSIYDISH